MLFLLDANILIYGSNPASPFFPDCRKATGIIAQNGDTSCIVPQSLYEFWSIATRPPNPLSPMSGLGMTTDQANAEIVAIRKVFPLFNDSSQILPEWQKLVTQYGVSGRDSHDARYVAAMNVHGITHIVTVNKKDFVRFSHITVLLPSEV